MENHDATCWCYHADPDDGGVLLQVSRTVVPITNMSYELLEHLFLKLQWGYFASSTMPRIYRKIKKALSGQLQLIVP